VSNAKFHSLAFVAIRHQPNGFPLEPTLVTKELGNPAIPGDL
jgi:hypothetical protein